MRRSSAAQERKLRQRARRYWPLAGLTLTVPGAPRPYHVVQPAFPEDLLDELAARPARAASVRPVSGSRERDNTMLRAAAVEARRKVDTGGHMPYWGLLWPSGLALAEELFRDAADTNQVVPLAQRPRRRRPRALELGCGLGVTATAALDAGLTLIAADCFPEALAFCRYNTRRNTGRMPATWLADWRTETGRAALALAAPYDLLLAADVLYEEPDIALLLDLAPRLVGTGGRFWLAEPGRRVSLTFVAEALARGWKDTPTVYERLWPPDGDYARVTIHRFVVR